MLGVADTRPTVRSYIVAAVAATVALGLSRAAWPVIEPTQSPLLLGAVVVSAWYGGLGPGLFATALGAVTKAYFFVSPTGSLLVDDVIDAIQLALFIGLAFLISSLTGALRRAQWENARLLTAERAARAEAEDANRAKDVFLATVSHELRTPLQAMGAWTEILRQRLARDVDAAPALDALAHGIAGQTRLIEDLLDVSRIVAGTPRLEIARVDVTAVVEAAVATARAADPDRAAEIRVRHHAAASVLGDRARLEQVVCNLVSNALKFTLAEGLIEVRVESADDRVRIVVSDTGRGIAADQLLQIFDEFWQIRPRGDEPRAGLGLGLAIVRRLVTLHGGTVHAYSDGPGHGATFVVELPRADRATRVDRRAARPHVVTPRGGPSR